VAKKKRLVIYLLVSLFGVLFLKNLYFEYLGQSFDHCDEIGHVHFKKNSDDHCHSAGSILSAVALSDAVYFISAQKFEIEFQLNFQIDSNFESPFLEGPRKPPRA
jgi:hypothetical protein